MGEDHSPALSSVCVFGGYTLHMQAQERFWILVYVNPEKLVGNVCVVKFDTVDNK